MSDDSNLMTPKHAMHIGWVKGTLENHGMFVRYVTDASNYPTDRLRVVLANDTIELIIPPPP